LDPVNIFAIASKHNRWLGVRQATVAQNVANANTPGYKSLEVEPFEAAMSATQLEMQRTSTNHIAPTSTAMADAGTKEDESWEVVHSGNNVSLEQQLLKSNEISGAYALNTGAVKAFHRMLMMSSRG
jgi:flagellar basal-body rod protein FlgB